MRNVLTLYCRTCADIVERPRGGSGDAGLADEVVPEGHATQPNRTNTVLAAQVLKEKHAVKVRRVLRWAIYIGVRTAVAGACIS